MYQINRLVNKNIYLYEPVYKKSRTSSLLVKDDDPGCLFVDPGCLFTSKVLIHRSKVFWSSSFWASQDARSLDWHISLLYTRYLYMYKLVAMTAMSVHFLSTCDIMLHLSQLKVFFQDSTFRFRYLFYYFNILNFVHI